MQSNQRRVNSLIPDIFFHLNLSTSKPLALKDLFIYRSNDFNTRSNRQLQVLEPTTHP